MAAIISVFFAATGWMFAQIMFPDIQYMVPVTIFLIHVVYVACGIMSSRRVEL